MTFLDVDAPDTAWRAGSEHPIPVIFGRYSVSAAVYRWFRCSPLDGHNRTDATFFRAGTAPWVSKTSPAAFQYWPGWKRGLLLTRVPVLLAPPTALAAVNEVLMDTGPWWTQGLGAVLPWTGHVAYFGTSTVQGLVQRKHRKNVLEPITAAAVNILRSRDIRVDIPRSMVRTEVCTDTGRLWLPMSWSGSDGDRDNLTDMLQERLGSPVSVSYDMSGRTPSAKLSIPKQPPRLVSWDTMLEHADVLRPFLGLSASGPVSWDLGDDSPHMGDVGGSGSGKSELMAWITAQFMRGGSGTVVLDPKGTSHAWLLQMPEVLYCSTGASLHDTIMWLDAELDRRAAANRESVMRGGTDLDFPRLVVLLEERNSLQDKLRDHWAEIRQPSQSQMSPAVRALDRSASMGRTLCITVLLAAQATAQQDIGKRNNYGAWAIAGRMAANHYKNLGVASKPGISAKPGRFAYVVAGQATVFQAAYPDLKRHSERLKEWARGGEPLLNVKMMMTQQETAAFPSVSPVSSGGKTEPFVTLGEYAIARGWTIAKVRNDRARKPGFPDPVTQTGTTHRFRETDLDAFYQVED